MLDYYEQRINEYERIYAKPERQQDLLWLEQQLMQQLAGRHVLELACGTGYWTRRIARNAETIVASDASTKLVDTAVKSCDSDNVSGLTIDAFKLPDCRDFNAIVAGFFFSHLLIQQRFQFLHEIRQRCSPHTLLLLFDNRYVEGSSTTLSRTDEAGNTYQQRSLEDGCRFEILKNFPDSDELQKTLQTVLLKPSVRTSQYFWLASGEFLD